MTTQITLNLPDNLIDHAQRFGGVTQRKPETVLSDALEMMWPMLEELPDTGSYLPITSLSDIEVLALAEAKMDDTQNKRLADLQTKGKTTGLSLAERYELLALLQIYQLGQLRKSEALAEAVRRGLRSPLPG